MYRLRSAGGGAVALAGAKRLWLGAPLARMLETMVGAGVKNRQGARLWLTLFAVIAFAFQSYSVQTHIHKSLIAGAPFAQGGKSAPSHEKVPPLDQTCPLCQAVAHAGVFVMPAAVAALAPTIGFQSILRAIETPIAYAPFHQGWQSRAPPTD